MRIDRLCIIGLGLIGGSVAMAAIKHGLCRNVVAFDTNAEALAQALDEGVIDQALEQIEQCVSENTLVVVATPVSLICDIVTQLFEISAQKGIDSFYVTDVGSVKGCVVDAFALAGMVVPPHFVPAHPIAGSEKNGVEHAVDDLLQNKKVILTPLPQTNVDALALVTQFWQGVGANTVEMTTAEHDDIFAATSHLPHILSFTYIQQMLEKNQTQPVFENVGGGFLDFTRIAASEPTVWADILLSNRAALIPLLDNYVLHIQQISRLIEQGDKKAMIEYLASVRDVRQQINGI